MSGSAMHEDEPDIDRTLVATGAPALSDPHPWLCSPMRRRAGEGRARPQ
ncbi:hypothetical protein QO014_003971 [Kaistia dalseonensis]|uniref:Uncharacterized protein n=1 Tax=Kaistia dalseonensis TaxID=410840 RepID=A0ABU0HB72_9HYPH|nr:hypothetical protein [Kaistia dalseonensis]